MKGADYINKFRLYFDGADMTNASLYLCFEENCPDNVAQEVIATLRQAGLWSPEPAKTVADEQKPMYAAQMQFIDALTAAVNNETFYATAYDHEKFKYTPTRWQAWKACLEANYPA